MKRVTNIRNISIAGCHVPGDELHIYADTIRLFRRMPDGEAVCVLARRRVNAERDVQILPYDKGAYPTLELLWESEDKPRDRVRLLLGANPPPAPAPTVSDFPGVEEPSIDSPGTMEELKRAPVN